MGNNSTKELTGETEGFKILNLSKKLLPEDYLKHVSGVYLEGSLVEIPADIIYYDTISMYEEVNFSFNFISFIPEEFSLRVPHLRHLDISHNQLTSLPNSFHLLLHLRVLDLSFNKFSYFPETVVHLSKLHTLNVSHNKLKDLPASIMLMKQLTRLNISKNNIRALPETILECPKLGVIVTLENNLIHPPQAVCDEGSFALLNYLKKNNVQNPPKTTTQVPVIPQPNVFTRIRGQQVMASVVNPESASREYKQAQVTARTNKRKCPLMVPEDATTLTPDQLRETILGLVYGACIGDAFGLNTEGLSRDECLFFYSNKSLSLKDRVSDLLRSSFPPNDWSSNVDIMLLTLESLMRWGGVVDELELASQIMQWKIHGIGEIDPFPGFPLSPLMQQVIQSDGFTWHPHSAAESVYEEVRSGHYRGKNLEKNEQDNSCLPAAVVLGIPNFYKEHEVSMNAERICRATHASPLARASSVFTALLAAALLQGKFQEIDADFAALFASIKSSVIKFIADEETKVEFEEIFNLEEKASCTSNDVAFALRYIIATFQKKEVDDFETAVSKLVMLGGEGICAHSCVLGGILGAYFGYSHIPQNWLKQLPQENLVWLNSKINTLLDLFGLP